MSKGKKRLKDQQEKEAKTLQALKANKGISKYQRKEMERRGVAFPANQVEA